MNGKEDARGDGVIRPLPDQRDKRGAAGVELIRVIRLTQPASFDPPPLNDQDARLVGRLIALLEEAMDLAKSRSGEAGRALIDNLAVEIFRVISTPLGPPERAEMSRADGLRRKD